MSTTLLLEQSLNGLQFGLMLFLIAAGLTLVFGIMDVLNLAHGSLYMAGAYLAATVVQAGGSFWIAVPVAVLATALLGWLLEVVLIRHLYGRDHLAQVLATFAVILIADDLVRIIWGPAPIMLAAPAALAGPVEILPGVLYPAYRLLIIAVGLVLALALYLFVTRTRTGMLVRAGSSNREMARLMGVRVDRLFATIFALGAALSAVAGALLGPLLAVEVGMGENILILALVVIVIGGIGSIRGALVGALLVGIVDTAGRAFLPELLTLALPGAVAAQLGPALAAIAIYLLMAAVLSFRPQGLFPAR
ncbi:MAG: branched-chain amino acid ABC transporter permease [Burkholderiaceae bacterium]|jgi:branched-chain amino acid transport system permease protein|nr:branched-chain amino acid ABC transporter permease [Burkholderiaceae bacterium]